MREITVHELHKNFNSTNMVLIEKRVRTHANVRDMHHSGTLRNRRKH